MFKHELAKTCKFHQNCNRHMCQYVHKNSKEHFLREDYNDKSIDTETIDSENDSIDKEDETFVCPRFYRKYIKINLVNEKCIDCYYCGFDTSHVTITESLTNMKKTYC